MLMLQPAALNAPLLAILQLSTTRFLANCKPTVVSLPWKTNDFAVQTTGIRVAVVILPDKSLLLGAIKWLTLYSLSSQWFFL